MPTSAKDIFLASLDLPIEARAAWLDDACSGNHELRQKVEALLRMHDEPDSLLDQPRIEFGLEPSTPSASFAPTVSSERITESAGMEIGPYTLLEQIGEGGFGVVFMAEQTTPVKRMVALKVIKPGMDTREVIARFEAERQALALMDHPNIAKVLDAGATETGRPFFVMELVKGVPITQFCDEHQQTPRERLELFVTVCQAVQHAHQKGIIHRDIKPTNVLVTERDDRPLVKIIDFGVAKAVSGQLTDKTLFTGFAQVVGTPLYMSPEQASLNGHDIDTRSDIYSLGVLLYELLTGSTPFDKARLQQAAFEEVRRIIREEEPQKPSTRLSSLGATLPSVSAVRKTEPRKLSQLVRGDLDWIVMKALEKDRARRYESANGFAADVLRFLADEPVTACPPSARYRFRKFARRNKRLLTMVLLVSLSLVAGTIVSTREAIRANNAEQLAERRLHDEQQARIEADEAHDEALANLRRAHEAVDRLLTHVGENELFQTPYLQELQRKLLEDALEFNEGFLAITGDDRDLQLEAAVARLRVGIIKLQMGEFAAAEQDCLLSLNELQSISAALPGDPRPRAEMVRACQNLGFATDNTHPEGPQPEEVRRRAVELIDQLIEDFPEKHEFQLGRASSYLYLGVVLMNRHKLQEAESVLNRARQWSQELDEASLIAQCSHELARLYLDTDRLDLAEAAARTAIDQFLRLDDGRGWYIRMTLGESHLRLKDILSRQGRGEEAEAELVQSVSVWTALSRDYPDRVLFPDRLSYVADLLAESLQARGELVAAAVAGRRSVEAECRLISLEPESSRHHFDLRIRFDRLDALLDQTGHPTERQQVSEDVMAIYRSLLAERPDDSALHTEFERFQSVWQRCLMERGSILDREQAARETIARLEARLDHDPAAIQVQQDLAFAYAALGKALHEGQRNDEALTAWQHGFDLHVRLLEAAPTDADRRQQFRTFRTSLEESLTQAGQTEETGRFTRETITLYEQLVAAHPEDSALTAELCIIRGRNNLAMQPQQALQDIKRAIELAPNDNETPWWYLDCANAWRSLQQNDQARAELSQAIEMWPDLWDAWVWRGTFHLDLEEWDAAVSDLSHAIELNPRYSWAWMRRGHAYSGLSQWDAAASDYSHFIELKPEFPWVWLHRGHTYSALKQWDKAAGDYSRAMELGVAQPSVWLGRSRANEQLEHWEQAAADYSLVLENQPQSISSLLGRARCLLRLGRFADARDDFQNAIEIQPDNADTHNTLAWLLATCPDPDTRDASLAVDLARRAVELKPRQASYWNTLGVARYRAGDWTAGIKALDKALELGGEQQLAFDAFLLAMAHWQLDHKDEARQWYDRAVQWMAENASEDEDLLRFRTEAAELLGIRDSSEEAAPEYG